MPGLHRVKLTATEMASRRSGLHPVQQAAREVALVGLWFQRVQLEPLIEVPLAFRITGRNWRPVSPSSRADSNR